jgi:hypothetical protein
MIVLNAIGLGANASLEHRARRGHRSAVGHAGRASIHSVTSRAAVVARGSDRCALSNDDVTTSRTINEQICPQVRPGRSCR